MFQTADTIDRYVLHEDLEHAYKLQLKADEIQKQINKSLSDLEQELKPLREEILSLLSARDRIVSEHQQADKTQEGAFFVKQVARPTERLDSDLFAETYPDEFESLWKEIGISKFKPSKADAAKVLTSYQIEKVCKPAGESKFVVDWDPRQGMPNKTGTVEP